MRILQINTVVNSGSTGRIAEDIGQVLMSYGHKSYIAYGRGNRPSTSNLIKIGNTFDVLLHGFYTAIFDRQGFGSKKATQKLLIEIDRINPDVVGLHNIHGYYLNIEVLFKFLAERKIPIVWTLHDCWAFTGHCAFFDSISCEKWKTQCEKCPKTRSYPSSYLIDNSKNNYLDKKRIFNLIKNGTIITPSNWLKNLVEESFLNYPVLKIHNGIDLKVFKQIVDVDKVKLKYQISDAKVVLGVASIWDTRKGLDDFIELQKRNTGNFQIVLVGLSNKQLKSLPQGIIGIKRTENTTELATLYSIATVFVNPTYQDNFPTTNIEALACGTPVITYKTGGSPEAIDEITGRIVAKGDLVSLKNTIDEVISIGKNHFSLACRKRAVEMFNKEDRFLDYLKVYEEISKQQLSVN